MVKVLPMSRSRGWSGRASCGRGCRSAPDLEDAHAVGVEHDGHGEAVFGVGGDAQVDARWRKGSRRRRRRRWR